MSPGLLRADRPSAAAAARSALPPGFPRPSASAARRDAPTGGRRGRSFPNGERARLGVSLSGFGSTFGAAATGGDVGRCRRRLDRRGCRLRLHLWRPVSMAAAARGSGVFSADRFRCERGRRRRLGSTRISFAGRSPALRQAFGERRIECERQRFLEILFDLRLGSGRRDSCGDGATASTARANSACASSFGSGCGSGSRFARLGNLEHGP